MRKISILQNSWRNLRVKLLSLSQPITSFNWRFLLPNQNEGVRVHRYVFLHAYPDFPFAFRALAYGYNLSRWWFYFAPKAIFNTYKNSHETCFNKHRITKGKQISDLISLAFAYCIPPKEYYAMRLHQWPRTKWLNFAYDFQTNAWHQAFNYKHAKDTQSIINDKFDFATFLNQHKLATIPTLQLVKKGNEITVDELNDLPQTSFFKPTDGNQSLGCFSLFQDDTIKHESNLRFIWFKDTSERPHKDLKDLNRLISKKNYLIQPMLINHPDFTHLFGTEKLATIRLVTSHINNTCTGLTAVLEAPLPKKPMFYWNVVIDIDTGEFIKPIKDIYNEDSGFEAWFSAFQGQTCPQWGALLSLCLQAHQKLPKQLLIGWDIALATKGPIIVEGNINWSLSQIQRLTQTPILSTNLRDVYRHQLPELIQ